MSSQRERWTTIKNGNIIEHSENDGYALMRRGFEHHDEIIMSVEEARKQGYNPDATVAGDDVINGTRPNPHMLYKNFSAPVCWNMLMFSGGVVGLFHRWVGVR